MTQIKNWQDRRGSKKNVQLKSRKTPRAYQDWLQKFEIMRQRLKEGINCKEDSSFGSPYFVFGV